MGLDRRAWMAGTAMLLACQLAARLITDPHLNVNAVFQVRAEAAGIFSSLPGYWLAYTASSVLVLFTLNRAIGYLPAKRTKKEDA